MNISDIILELKNNKVISGTDFSIINGGTTSKLYLADTNCVIKINLPQVLKEETMFLNKYAAIPFFPTLKYHDPANRYIVYSFIKGTTTNSKFHKSVILRDLVIKVLNHYESTPASEGWGWSDEPVDSWQAYLQKRADDAHRILQKSISAEDTNLIHSLIKKENRDPNERRYLLHGDCGFHNFIFDEGELCAVIDPTPVLGPRIYDLIYAFCSSPDDLSKETIESIASCLLEDNFHLYEQVLIGLYLRIAACVKHHPEDLWKYLDAWQYWKEIVKKENEHDFTFRK